MLYSKNRKNLGILNIALLIGLIIPACSDYLLAKPTVQKQELKPSVCQISLEKRSSKNSTLTACNPRKPTKITRTCDVGAFVIDKDPKGSLLFRQFCREIRFVNPLSSATGGISSVGVFDEQLVIEITSNASPKIDIVKGSIFVLVLNIVFTSNTS